MSEQEQDLFTVDLLPEFVAPVELSRPGKPSVAVDFHFLHQDREQLKEWGVLVKEKPEAAIAKIVVGWGKGMKQAYSPDYLQALLRNYYNAAGEIIDAYAKGIREARRKN